MDRFLDGLRRFLAELKRRKVYRVAIAYVAAAFAGLEGLDLLVPITALPSWAPRLFLALAILGFPVALVVAWMFELGPGGVRRTEQAEARPRARHGAPAEAEAARPEATAAEPTAAAKSAARERRTAEEPARSTPRPARAAAALLAALLIGAGLWWVLRPDALPTPDPDPSGRRVVAVLPFTTSGPGVDDLGEGMVNLLSTALDGAGGVRAVDQRTVLSRWDRTAGAGTGGEGDLGTALEVARGLGAEWAVVGSVVSVGEDARFVARVLRPADGERLGEAQVEGARDSLLSTVDDLTRQILGVIFERGEDVPRVPMASLTTESVPALKAFLSGERHYRNGRLDSALLAYERATEADSTFALAWLRRGIAHSWANMTTLFPIPYLAEAYRHRRGLPERARLVVVGAYLFGRDDPRAADTLKLGTERYPDDSELWYWLGETRLHILECGGRAAADSAFSRATELNPGFAPYWVHFIQAAFTVHHDSALAVERIESMERAEEDQSPRTAEAFPPVPGSDSTEAEARRYRAWPHWIRLVFGSGSIGERTEAFLDAVERGALPRDEAGFYGAYTGHPTDWALRDTLLRRALAREVAPLSEGVANRLVQHALWAGRIGRAAEAIRHPEIGDRRALFALARNRAVGVPVPDSLLRGRLMALRDVEVSGFFDLFARSIAAMQLDAPELAPPVEAVLSRLEEGSGADTTLSASVRRAIDAYRAWTAGEEETALELLERGVPRWTGGRFWRADLYRSAGRLEEAARCYRTNHPYMYLKLGDVLAEMGKEDEAVEAYRTFLDVWQGSEDPAARAKVDSVLARVIELSEPLESAESDPGG